MDRRCDTHEIRARLREMNWLRKRFWPVMADLDVRLGESVTAFRIWAILTPFTATTLMSHVMSEIELAPSLVAAAFGALVSVAMLWLASVSIFRDRHVHPPSLAVTLAFWMVVGAAAYLASDTWIRDVDGGGDGSEALERDTFRYAIAFTLRGLLMTIFVVALRETNRAYGAIERATDALKVAGSRSAEYIEMLRSRYMELVRNELEPRLRSLVSDVRAMSGHSEDPIQQGRLADGIQSLGSSNVRQLSRLVAYDVETQEPNESSSESDRAERATGRNPLHGWLTVIPPTAPVIVVFLVLRFGFGTYEVPSLALIERVTLLCALTAMILFVGRSVASRVSDRSGPAVLSVGLLVLVFVTFSSIMVSLWAAGSGDPVPVAPFAMTVHMVGSLVGVWLVNYSVTAKMRAAAELKASIAALEHIKSARDIQGQRIRLQLATVLHGPIQGRLALASMTIRQSIDDPRHADPEYRDQIYGKVLELLRSIEAEIEHAAHLDAPRLSYDELLTFFELEWAGVISVSSSVSPEAQVTLDTDSDLNYVLVQVVEEAVMNARKHGRARVIAIAVNLHELGPQHLTLTVMDNGLGIAKELTPGLGSNIYDRLTGGWSLSSLPSRGSIFRAVIPVSDDVSTSVSMRELATAR